MRQERHARRKPFPKFLPFIAGALVAGSVLVACDRPTNDADAGAAREQAAAPQASAPMDVRTPKPAPVAQAPTRAAAPLPPPEALADSAITSRIKAEIAGDPAMHGADVSVNTDRGVVVLAGLVKTPEQTAIASSHADRQDGVMRVDNQLSIASQ
jgi:osmotically-inducible protein OsmY